MAVCIKFNQKLIRRGGTDVPVGIRSRVVQIHHRKATIGTIVAIATNLCHSAHRNPYLFYILFCYLIYGGEFPHTPFQLLTQLKAVRKKGRHRCSSWHSQQSRSEPPQKSHNRNHRCNGHQPVPQ